jgi:nitrogen fixation protein NifX
VIYEVTPAGSRLVATHAFPAAAEDGDEDKLAPRLAALAGCAILCSAAIGGSASARVRALGVHPAKVPDATPIAGLLEQLRAVLAGSTPPWLRRVLGRGDGAGPFDTEEVKP